MRSLLLALPLLLIPLAPSQAAVNVGIGISMPGVSIGINMPAYPRLVRVPGYPVYYAPSASANYFFYDGLYWVYRDDTWYHSVWYNGPWQSAEPTAVPLFVLRVPVRYYRQPPIYFRGWASSRPPRWGEHWGRDWEARHPGWDRWDRREQPVMAPLPTYQRAYSGDRYPREVEQQHAIRREKYRYDPRDPVAKQTFQQHGGPAAADPGPAAKPVGQASPRAEARAEEKALAKEERRENKNLERGKDKPQ